MLIETKSKKVENTNNQISNNVEHFIRDILLDFELRAKEFVWFLSSEKEIEVSKKFLEKAKQLLEDFLNNIFILMERINPKFFSSGKCKELILKGAKFDIILRTFFKHCGLRGRVKFLMQVNSLVGKTYLQKLSNILTEVSRDIDGLGLRKTSKQIQNLESNLVSIFSRLFFVFLRGKKRFRKEFVNIKHSIENLEKTFFTEWLKSNIGQVFFKDITTTISTSKAKIPAEDLAVIRKYLLSAKRSKETLDIDLDQLIVANPLFFEKIFFFTKNEDEQKYIRKQLAKTGSELYILGRNLASKALMRYINREAYVCWKAAFDASEVWKENGFSYVPVEEIFRSFNSRKNTNMYRVYCGVLDMNVHDWLTVTSSFSKEIRLQIDRIKKVLEHDLKIDHGHTHDRNFCLRFERKSDLVNGVEVTIPDFSKPPQVYLIDFDRAAKIN